MRKVRRLVAVVGSFANPWPADNVLVGDDILRVDKKSAARTSFGTDPYNCTGASFEDLHGLERLGRKPKNHPEK